MFCANTTLTVMRFEDVSEIGNAFSTQLQYFTKRVKGSFELAIRNNFKM